MAVQLETLTIVAPSNSRLISSPFSISSSKKVARLGSAAPAPQGEHLCRTNRRLSDKGTARYRRATVWIGHKTIPRNSSKSAFRNQGIFPVGSCRCVATRQGDAGRVLLRGRAALSTDAGRCKSPPNEP